MSIKKYGEPRTTLTGSIKYPEHFASGINSGGLVVFMIIVSCFPPDMPLGLKDVISSEQLALRADMSGLDRNAARVGWIWAASSWGEAKGGVGSAEGVSVGGPTNVASSMTAPCTLACLRPSASSPSDSLVDMECSLIPLTCWSMAASPGPNVDLLLARVSRPALPQPNGRLSDVPTAGFIVGDMDSPPKAFEQRDCCPAGLTSDADGWHPLSHVDVSVGTDSGVMMGVMAVKVVPNDGFLVRSTDGDGSLSETTTFCRDILMTSFADGRRDTAGDKVFPATGVAAPT